MVGIDGSHGQGVADLDRSDQLGTFQGLHRARGHRTGGHTEPRQHAGRTQQGEGQRGGLGAGLGLAVAVADHIHQFVFEQAFVDHRQPPAGHEPAGGEGGRAELLGSALGLEATLDDGEGAFGRQRSRPARGGEGGPGGDDPVDGLSKRVRTLSTDSSALISRVVSTTTGWLPTLDLVLSSTWSGQLKVEVMVAVARTGPRSPAVIDTDSGTSTIVSTAGGE